MKPAIKITLIYLIIGVSWIFFSDRLLLIFYTKDEMDQLVLLQTIKGIFYILSTAAILFFLILRYNADMDNRLQRYKRLNIQLQQKSTEITRTEKEFADLFSLNPLSLWVYDTEESKFLIVNNAALKHYGYSQNEFLSLSMSDIQADDLSNSRGKILLQGRTKHKKQNGEIIDVDLKSSYIEYKGKKAKIVLVTDITNLLKTQHSLEIANSNIIKVEELERARFAGELHDSLIQNLVATKHFFSMLPTEQFDDASKKFHGMIKGLIESSITECQRVIYDLRPKDLSENGLKPALLNIISKYNQGAEFKIVENIDDRIDESQLSDNIKFNLYRIFQENVTNTLKHSKAQQAEIHIWLEDKKIKYEFKDNGDGLLPATLEKENSFLSIKQRLASIGGKFSVQSSEKKGTRFYFVIPVKENE